MVNYGKQLYKVDTWIRLLLMLTADEFDDDACIEATSLAAPRPTPKNVVAASSWTRSSGIGGLGPE